MAKSKTKPAFPGRANAMGYEPGLSRLEWIVAQLLSSESMDSCLTVDSAVRRAKEIIKACEAVEATSLTPDNQD